uniref:Uncharacterized protein n=1 Tax=Meloidogyne incognita TaxID=6306 RepID=A0A914KKS0_MELIC
MITSSLAIYKYILVRICHQLLEVLSNYNFKIALFRRHWFALHIRLKLVGQEIINKLLQVFNTKEYTHTWLKYSLNLITPKFLIHWKFPIIRKSSNQRFITFFSVGKTILFNFLKNEIKISTLLSLTLENSSLLLTAKNAFRL